MNENEIFMGSTTVLADGGPLSFTAVPSLSCHDIGMIAPPRKKKPKKSFGMVLPTSVVLSIPLGMPVMVGGAPTIDMMGLAIMGGFAALGGAFKKLRKIAKEKQAYEKNFRMPFTNAPKKRWINWAYRQIFATKFTKEFVPLPATRWMSLPEKCLPITLIFHYLAHCH